MNEKHLEIKVENSPTILLRIIQVIKRRRVNIKTLKANEVDDDLSVAEINIVFEADNEKASLLKTQIKKMVEVIAIK